MLLTVLLESGGKLSQVAENSSEKKACKRGDGCMGASLKIKKFEDKGNQK